MKKSIMISLIFLLGCWVAVAQDTPAPEPKVERVTSLDALLDLVEKGKSAEAKEHREREKRFREAKDKQAQLLQEAKDKVKSEEQRSKRLERTFDENERKTAELVVTLEKELGDLKELFGVLQQAAGDTRGTLESSITSMQFPGRADFLTELAEKMGSTSKLATIEDIERLWYEMQREMTESGKISKFRAPVITAGGEKLEKDVVRIGAFNVISEDRYLNYEPSTGNISELPRQPQPRYTASAGELYAAQSGFTKFGLDPGRGSILSLLIQSPNLRERIDQGGLVGYLIIGLGALALLIAIERLLVLFIVGVKVRGQLKNATPSVKNPLGRVLNVAREHQSDDRETLELKMGEAILKEAPSLGRALGFLKIISVVAPLMGLLGTVTGMINTFQAITLYGTGDPKLMAGGISQALVTTVLGLTVAIPTVLLHSVVGGRSKKILHILEEQSAGILAEHTEAEASPEPIFADSKE
jgi:biopolymer transport protein ExbB